MRLVLFQIDALGLVVRSHWAMLLLAVVVALLVGPRWAEAFEGIPRRTTFRVHILLAIAALAGGHFHFMINQPLLGMGRMPWEGLHAGGAVIGLLLAAPLVFAWYRVHPGRMADALMPVSGVCIFIARLGCFLNGCCHGTGCSYPWCLSFPPEALPAQLQAQQKLVAYGSWSLPVHPLQLYFAFVGLVITAVAFWLLPRKRHHGQVALVSLLVFALGAYWLEPFRADTLLLRSYVGKTPQLQLVALWLVGAAAAGLAMCELGHRLFTRRTQPRVAAP
jgi:phosphatidylglycerol:prolipoprotein diacylglycerol transferase